METLHTMYALVLMLYRLYWLFYGVLTSYCISNYHSCINKHELYVTVQVVGALGITILISYYDFSLNNTLALDMCKTAFLTSISFILGSDMWTVLILEVTRPLLLFSVSFGIPNPKPYLRNYMMTVGSARESVRKAVETMVSTTRRSVSNAFGARDTPQFKKDQTQRTVRTQYPSNPGSEHDGTSCPRTTPTYADQKSSSERYSSGSK